MAIAFSGTHQFGQHLGDTISSIKVAWMWAESHRPEKILLVLSECHDLNFMWQKFRDTFNVEVVYDKFDPGSDSARFGAWNQWRKERHIEGKQFDIFKELYRRIDGGHRQGAICGQEKGLGRKNIFEYFYFGQEQVIEPCIGGDEFDGPKMFYAPPHEPIYDVLVAPYAKCQGNRVFTFDYWSAVVHQLIDAGLSVTVNHNGPFCEELNGKPGYRKIFPSMKELQEEICRHRIVTCGNTGIGWMTAACGVPLLAMQPIDSHIQDYRYEWCGVKALVEYIEDPDSEYCARRLVEECRQVIVLTTGCYDIIHPGHIKHLEESKSYGHRLVVALNSDSSVQKLKGKDRPIQKQQDRELILRAMRCVDDVVIFDGPNALSVIESIRPNIITNGSDHKIEEIVGKAFVESYGGQAIVTGGERSVSTTTIVRKMVNRDLMAVIREAEQYSINPSHKLIELAKQVLSVAGVTGELADIGAYRGSCSLVMRRLAPERRLHVFDTWQGNPYDDPLCHHKKGEWKADLDEAKRVVGENEQTVFYPGVFPATAAGINGAQFALVFIDGDTYQTTKAAIEFFWPRLVPGGKLMFDDVPWEPCAGTEKAINEAFPKDKQHRINSANACVVTK